MAEDPVPLHLAGARFDAEVLATALDAAGVRRSPVLGDDSGGTRPYLGWANGYYVLVAPGDLDAARAVVGSGHGETGAPRASHRRRRRTRPEMR